MAPVKPGPSSHVAKNIATSLSSPVSLLWAHQLRREHGALLARVEGLAAAVSHASSAQLNEIAALVTKAEAKSRNIESEYARLKKELHRVQENEKGLSDELARISERFDDSGETISALRKDFHTLEERLSKRLIDELATVERKLQQRQKEQDQQVRELKTQFRDIQTRLPDTVKEGVIGVRDSMEETRQQMNQIAEHEQRPTIRRTDIDAHYTSCFVQPNNTQSEDMVALKPIVNTRAELDYASDIDVDDAMLPTEPVADEVSQALPGETTATLPGTPVTEYYRSKDSDLRQGKFQSWDQYFADGEASILKLPKRKEGGFVEAFVNGMSDDRLRRKCEMMLDEIGWSWENVKSFVMKTASTAMEAQDRQLTTSLTHQHRKGEICPICPRNVNIPQTDNEGNEIRKSSPREPLQQPSQRPVTANSRRRSQRIRRQIRANPVRSESIVKPKPSKGRTAKHTTKSQTATQETSAHILRPEEAQANVEIAKQSSAATESREATFIGSGGILTMPRGEAEQKSLAVLHQNVRISQKSRTTPEVPRGRGTTLTLETQPQHPATFQPVTPINHTNHHYSNALPNSDVNPPTLVPDVPSKDDSKKRKLVEQLEIPDTIREGVVTLLDQEIKQTEPDERGRKKRRKKRAAAPIPMIPILPLSDDE